MFTKLRVKTLLTSVLALMIVLLIVTGGMGIYSSKQAVDLLQHKNLVDAQSDASIARIKFRMEMNRADLMLALQHNPSFEFARLHDHPTENHLRSIEHSSARINQLWKDYLATIESPEEKKRVEDWHANSGRLGLDGINAAVAAIKANKWDEAQRILLTVINPTYVKGQEASLVLAQYLNDRIKNNNQAVKESLARAEYIMYGLVGLGILCALAAGFVMLKGIYGQLGGEPAYAAEIASRIASGDLTSEVETKPGDTSSLLYAMRHMQDSLVSIVSQVRGGTDMIATASAQIAAGNQDLSSRTEEQAASLEETASSMEELTSTVRQNADNARQANRLAVAASGIAVKGGNVVSQVVDTMGGINESSRKIADIISVIDGIAFQTNILALNAAVEAARAGEQGRGFAVVASEVRNLAQRSASAAREIKTLIDDSVEKVESGSKLVNDAGETMQEIVTSIQRVTDIMGEITAASNEQSDGIEQVNQAIVQMDQVTQQNAALVEEAAAAAESLQDQAQNLVEVVSVFRTGGSQAMVAAASVRAKVVSIPSRKNAAPAKAVQQVALPAPGKKVVGAKSTSNEDWEEF